MYVKTAYWVASFAEAWIEILYLIQLGTIILRRLLRGGVDWNHEELYAIDSSGVASFAEAWIEIGNNNVLVIRPLVASFAEAWIEIGNPHYSSRCCYIVSSQR